MEEAQGKSRCPKGAGMTINTNSIPEVFLGVFIALLFIGCGMCLFSLVVTHYIELFTKRPQPLSRSGKILIAVYVIIFAVTGWLIYGK